MMIRPTTADSTDPREKNTERAVTRYCLPLGICSSSRVPSVGMDPYIQSEVQYIILNKKWVLIRTPTALPSRNSAMHRVTNVFASEARMPKTDVKNNVALKAVVRPIKSEPGVGSVRQ